MASFFIAVHVEQDREAGRNTRTFWWAKAEHCSTLFMRILGLSLIDSSVLHDLYLSFGVFSALLHSKQLHMQHIYMEEWPFINFIIDFFFWESFEVFTFEIFFHKRGQTKYESSILPSQRCCHDDRARHSCPPRVGEKKERKWKDAERRYKMMRKLKRCEERGWEETTRKSETLIKGGWRDNRMKGPQIRENWCSQVLAQQSSWLFMLYTL